MEIETQAAPSFTVDPLEGTVVGPGGTVRLEPKVMDVLRLLTRHSGHVVARAELMDTVWPDVVVTEHTLSRCIYQLRTELGRIAGDPDFQPIETLPKRGYRLLANVETRAGQAVSLAPGSIAALPTIPYVVGQWVRGERFYGRTAQITEILEGHRNCIWLLGTRRIGKTSLLKQLEYLAESLQDRRYFPVFWDFQGAATAAELHLNFRDALLDAEDRLERIGIPLDEVAADDLFDSLERLRRRLRAKQTSLLLLCDEVEELIGLYREDPGLLRKLRRVMQSREDVRTVLASTIRLWALAGQKGDTSPFLHGFTPPLYIERLADDEARSLIEQSNLAPEGRLAFADDDIDAIQTHCDNHPYLVQLVCKRYAESGDLDEAIAQVATDRMVSYFFSVDFDMLSRDERDVVRTVAGQTSSSSDAIAEDVAIGPDALAGTLRGLENLGFIRSNASGEFELANYFFRRWLQGDDDVAGDASQTLVPGALEEHAIRESDDKPATESLFSELRRRNVFRVGIVYVLVSWVLLQLGEILFEFLEVPTWAGKLLIVLLSLGLPVALVLAWAFELTPDGVKRDPRDSKIKDRR